ncbi:MULTISPECIES: 30S ribosomal protein S8 [Clostridium]|jgi:small subunit ribosomal protein S8|uniref:Small ribosomal subunit protein uS8 n=5 Tax=Clostridium TaxID=1485 RepID=RS8_CLOB6|nr:MULTISPECIES: 30S ribosomal protein S8 [Clostridium]C3KVN7.1 RecName: Full=Small ribosomal subunit protein uS8; AltName: Full=30S ribosomal protein S8 [Clostridium botulinum Ba4 str. 657]AJD26789.1 30S ribosomal protein S8 [Clostridium botulinum CDC_297]AJD32345.1 30S ribosomal protein S8 [Clostridium botulinum Prevot_594]EPS48025.1 30S ribosomal protein S8 [Clostridium botulinum A1 str. CFSAN002368]MBE6078542.1 30S ribosomal protein S8 [Clostridium lundense]ACQ51622.1 30S ribosomal protei
MVMSDPIADLLTRIRNANVVRHEVVEVPSSNIKKAIANIMLTEGYIRDLEEYRDGSVDMLRISMKYGQNKERIITGLKRISKPGLRVYCRKDETPKVLNGLGVAVVSTSKGIVTDREARKLGVGGEVLCYIW